MDAGAGLHRPTLMAGSGFHRPFGRTGRSAPGPVLISGCPWHSALIVSEFLKVFRQFHRSALADPLAVGSAVCVHRPRYWQRLGPPSAGRVSTGEPVDIEASASGSSLFVNFQVATLSSGTDQQATSTVKGFERISQLLNVDSQHPMPGHSGDPRNAGEDHRPDCCIHNSLRSTAPDETQESLLSARGHRFFSRRRALRG